MSPNTPPESDDPPPIDAWHDAGRVMRAHGVRGELRAELHLDAARLQGRPVRLLPRVGEPRLVVVQGARPVHQAVLLTLEGLDSREDAQLLAGARLQIQERDVPAPGQGEFYIYELTGALLVDHSVEDAGRPVGTVARVADNQGQALLVLEPGGPGATERLLPLVPALIRRFDRAARTLHVTVPAGLWEDEP